MKRVPKLWLFNKQKQFFAPLKIIGHLDVSLLYEQQLSICKGLMIKGHLRVCLMFCPRIKRVLKLLRLLETVEERKEVAPREGQSERASDRERGGEMGSASERDGLR
jgi:hypothetical protein